MKNKNIIITSIVCCIIIFITIIAGFKHSAPITAKQIFNSSVKGIVELKAYSKDVGESYGTAVFLKKNGTLVSNAHVVTFNKSGEVKLFQEYSIRFINEEEYHPVLLIKYDVKKDIAILRLEDKSAKFKAIKIGNSEKLAFGDKVYAIGNGSNYGLGITQGIISIPKMNITYENNTREVIQADITISAGNSGGALLDSKGNLIGITTFRIKDLTGNVVYGLVYSIPINNILEFL